MEREKKIETVMAFSPIERRIDMYGCEIGVSRQWYDEATAILMEINEGKYLKVSEGAVVLTKEEYIDLSRNYVKEQKAQAVKEFAEELKAKTLCITKYEDGTRILQTSNKLIDQSVKIFLTNY